MANNTPARAPAVSSGAKPDNDLLEGLGKGSAQNSAAKTIGQVTARSKTFLQDAAVSGALDGDVDGLANLLTDTIDAPKPERP